MELLISWSSERLIEYEEQQKLRLKTERSSVEIQEDPYCREMLFFVDFENPINSSIPEMYQQKNSYMKRKKAYSIVMPTFFPAVAYFSSASRKILQRFSKPKGTLP